MIPRYPTMLSILFVRCFRVFLYVVATVDVTDQTMLIYFSVPKTHTNINTNNKSCRIWQMAFENDVCTELGHTFLLIYRRTNSLARLFRDILSFSYWKPMLPSRSCKPVATVRSRRILMLTFGHVYWLVFWLPVSILAQRTVKLGLFTQFACQTNGELKINVVQIAV